MGRLHHRSPGRLLGSPLCPRARCRPFDGSRSPENARTCCWSHAHIAASSEHARSGTAGSWNPSGIPAAPVATPTVASVPQASFSRQFSMSAANPVASPGPSKSPGDPSQPIPVDPPPTATPQNTPLAPPVPIITLQGNTLTANAASAYILGSQTLAPGGAPITVSGTPISLAPSATALFVAGTTIPLPLSSSHIPPAAPGPAHLHITTLSSAFPFGSAVYTENVASGLVIGTQTLTPGGKITVSGTIISLGAGGGGTGGGGAAATSAGSSPQGLGAVILSAFGGAVPAGGTSSTTLSGKPSSSLSVSSSSSSSVNINAFKGAAAGRADGMGRVVFTMLTVVVSVVMGTGVA